MKTEFGSTICAMWNSFSGTICAGAVMLIASSAQAQYNYTTIDDPSATEGTTPLGIDGNNIVGYYAQNGFIYNISTASHTTLNVPSSIQTFAHGIDGSNIGGTYYSSSGYSGFLYNGSSYARAPTVQVDS